MNDFLWPQTPLLSTWTDELVDWRNHSVSRSDKRIIFYRGKHWFIKYKPDPEHLKRDHLAYLLGQDLTNVAEVLPLDEEQFRGIVSLGAPLPQGASIQNTYLVRLAQDYEIDELQNTDIDTATAAELVFSLWIRRRDTHAANRVYKNEIPIFFDYETAFLAEPWLKNPYVFFLSGDLFGYAGRWRTRILAPNEKISTMNARHRCLVENLALQFVKNYERLDKSITSFANRLKEQPVARWNQAISKAGYDHDNARRIIDFLSENLQNLESSVEMMRSVLLSPSIPLNYWKHY